MIRPFMPKKRLSVRLAPDVIAWFKAQGRGDQTKMHDAPRASVQAKRAANKPAE
jgi:uncharacterized protein (DUF4415 family)